MKPPVLLAALLLLPASVASADHQPAGFPVSAPVGVPDSAPDSAASVRTAVSLHPGISTAAGGLVAAPSWRWPLAPRPPVLRAFDPPPKPWLSGHRGVDLGAAGDRAQVMSPAAGTVSFAGVVVDRPVITIDHGGGLRSSFEPVDTVLAVGAVVAAGQVIGTALPGHCPPAECVHWGVRDGEEYVNPLQFVVDLRPSVLLPLPGAPGQVHPGRTHSG
ncbi:peptidoglycan DD-metalloendopeptidase family protein [Arthrobacter sp. MAHUQ-56]